MGIPEAHMPANHPAARRNSVAARAYPLNELDRPSRADGPDAIVRYLAVETSARYQRSTSSTYCNIYACDFCYLSGVYLPRVWWTDDAIEKIAAGETVRARYGETVREVNALFVWLKEHGPEFGWREVVTADELQRAVNAGAVGAICAQRKTASASGHIAMVVPETSEHRAERVDGVVRLPLQSQAGARNYAYGSGISKWWAGAQFRAFGFFVHD